MSVWMAFRMHFCCVSKLIENSVFGPEGGRGLTEGVGYGLSKGHDVGRYAFFCLSNFLNFHMFVP